MGLNDEEVNKSRQLNGSNSLNITKRSTIFQLIIEALGDPIIKILLIALAIKTVFMFRSFDWFETIGILIAVLLATLISSLSEYGSENAFSKLQETNSKIKTKVYRNDKLTEIEIDEIVVGDKVLLNSGDKVPADGYIIEGSISVDESTLNGESKEVQKTYALSENKVDEKNKVYRGTVIYDGNATVKITNVGINTLYGKIFKELTDSSPDSPLKIRLRKLAKIISKLGYIGALIAGISYLFQNIVINNNFDQTLILNTLTNFNEMADLLIFALTMSVTIIVVAVPEGLPMMITLVLASNVKKMLKDNVLVRKMVGIETAGSMNILLTDKTGTLTKGKLKVTSILDAEGNKYRELSEVKNKKLRDEFEKSLYFNNESTYVDGKVIGGNSTDKAIMEFIQYYKIKYKVIERKNFNSINKFSEVRINDEEKSVLLKGAAEVIIPKCKYFINKNGLVSILNNKDNIYTDLKRLTSKGNRIIVLSKKINNDYIYIGMISIKDDLRKEAYEGVKKIKNAGIDIIMITGDSKDTAKIIAKEVGIVKKLNDIILTSKEFNELNEEELLKKIDNIKVIARALPQDKSKLVKLLQSKNLIVGMTGDGVNDAPALKKADVGFAMGSGTEVAKEASDIVILDNNIFSISKAILYGRTIFKSIRKFIVYQLSINICALIISIVGTLMGIHEPITIIQMLWLNMIMDTFAGLAFSFEPALDEYMEEKPKNKNVPIMNKYMISEIVVGGLYISVICLLFLKLDFVREIFRVGENNIYLNTSYFALFIFLGVFNSLNARTERTNIFANLLQNKIFICIFTFIALVQVYIIYVGGTVFRTYGLTLTELIIIFIISLTIIPVDILRKIILKKKKGKTDFWY